MAPTRTARFKAAFGKYSAGDAAEWRASADRALLSLERAIPLMDPVELDPAPSENILDVQQRARGTAQGQEALQPLVACAGYRAVANAADAEASRIRAVVIAARPTASTLQALVGTPQGRAALDAIVASFGGKADSDNKRRFVAEAIKARFGLSALTGDLSTKAMPRLYELLRRLPAEHTTDNDSLETIERHKAVGASLYGKQGSRIVLNASTAGSRGKKIPYDGGAGPQEVKVFDAMALHEVGHSVDPNDTIMGTVRGRAEFGAWREETEDSILDVADGDLRFGQDFPTIPLEARKRMLRGLLTGEVTDPRKMASALEALQALGADRVANDAGIQAALARRKRAGRGNPIWSGNAAGEVYAAVRLPKKELYKDLVLALAREILQHDDPEPDVDALIQTVFGPILDAEAGPDLSAVATHRACLWLQDIGKASESKWRQSQATLEANAVGGRVYQISYKEPLKQYNSYAIAARDHLVRPYQFRAEGEWFAEVYAVYFMGIMDPGHVAYDWLHDTLAFGDPPARM